MSTTANPLTDLMIKAGVDLARATRTHLQTCECADCETLLSIWLALDDEGHAQIAEVWENSFPGCPVESDDAKRGEDALLSAAISAVIEGYDSADLPDISDQVVSFIMEHDVFQPLRQRIYSSLFDS